MGKYGESVGKFMLDCEGYKKELMLQVGDGRRIIQIMSANEKNKENLAAELKLFMYDIIARNDRPANLTEETELKLFVDISFPKLIDEFLIAFRLTTREEISNKKKTLFTNGA